MAVLLIISCSVSQTVKVALDASGSAHVRVELHPVFHEYLSVLREEAGELGLSGSGEIFDTERIKQSLSELPGVVVYTVSTPTPAELEVDLSFRHVGEVLEGEETGVAEVVTFSQNGKEKSLRFYLDAENYSRIKPLLPTGEDPILDALGPQPDDPLTEQEYLDIVEFALGPEGPAVIQESFLEIRFAPEGEITSYEGGELEGDEVVFRIPLLQFLLLEEPIEYNLSFQ
jgi:hypothetical protein